MLKVILMAVSVLLCAEAHEECHEIPLISGIKNRVCDNQLSASSCYSSTYDASKGRLRGSNSWHVKYEKMGEWIQVDFGKLARITGIATQGRHNYAQWVKSYIVKYSTDCSTWKSYPDGGPAKIFLGNWDQNSARHHCIVGQITARCVRIYPQTWYGAITLRWEIYGCILSGKASNCEMETCAQECKAKIIGG